MACVASPPKEWCKGPSGGGKWLCMACQKAEKNKGASPSSAPLTSQRTPAKAAVSQTQPTVVRKTALPAASKFAGGESLHASSSSQAKSIADELKWLKEKKALDRTPPASFAGKFAYRGVNSNPNIYRKRDGFQPHQIQTLQMARSTLKNFAFTEKGLNSVALKWQASKDKVDGFFLSTGLSIEESYDTYPFLYRIDIGSLRYREWDGMGFNFRADSVDNCWLFTDNEQLDASKMIAIICLAQGSGRSYELLIMSPVLPNLCAVEDGSRTRRFISFNDWTAKYGRGRNPDGTGPEPE